MDYKNRCVMKMRVLYVIKICVMEGRVKKNKYIMGMMVLRKRKKNGYIMERRVVSPFTPPTMPR